MSTLNPTDFAFYKDFLFKKSGYALEEKKVYLLQSRLLPVARAHHMSDLSELASALRKRIDSALETAVIDAMTINETSFFRDQRPFDQFEKIVLPYLLEARAARRKIRIWCAACSSGQEPYSLAMILKNNAARLDGWGIEIIATDIGTHILAQAQKGVYSQFEVQRGMPVAYLVKYFTKLEDNRWQIKDEIRNMVSFRKLNLIEPMPALGSFDLIFCRNVLIYFDPDTKRAIVEKLAKVAADDGMLYLGSAESLYNLSQSFLPISGHPGLHARRGDIFEKMAVTA